MIYTKLIAQEVSMQLAQTQGVFLHSALYFLFLHILLLD